MKSKQYQKRKQRKQNKLLLDKIKSKGCEICGEKELCCLEFHHINPETKINSVINMLDEPKEVILEEVNKCIILCANCHRKVHAGLIILK